MEDVAGKRRSIFKHKPVIVAVVSFGALVLSTYYLNRTPDWSRSEPGKALLQARSMGHPGAYRDLISKYPNTPAARAAAVELPAAILNEARKSHSSATYRALLKDYPDSTEAHDATAELPGALLSEARLRNSVAAFRSVIQEFPETPEAEQAKAEIHALYTQAQSQFRSRFQDATPQTAFIEKLAGYLENNDPKIEVRYITYKGRKTEFTQYEPYSWDADTMLDGLRPLFADFPGDTVRLETGDALDEPYSITCPTIAIEYVMRSNDNMYSSKGGGFAVGEDATLKMSLRIPGEELKIDLAGTGRTPLHFTAPEKDTFMVPSKLAIEAAMTKIQAQFFPPPARQQGKSGK